MTTSNDPEYDELGRRVLRLTDPQFELVTTDKRFPAMVAGFGSGKTEALLKRAMRLKFAYPMLNIAYYMPTYDLIRTIAFPRFEEMLAEMGFVEGGPNAHYKTIKTLTPMIKFNGYGEIIMRTMDNPARIVGYEVADSFVDELDTLKEADAKLVWQKIFARNRQKKPDGEANTIAVGTTPEGFRFVYNTWHKEPPSDEYELIKASTYSNARNLPDNYISDMIALYPANLIEAYLNGEFVNLTSGTVYLNYNRFANGSNETIKTGEEKAECEDLHIGMDFNVTKMSAVVFVQRGNDPHAVAELTGVFDTPAMIKLITERWKDKGHNVYVYPDASGNARKSNDASVSDISLLRGAGFTVFANSANPAVRDRVLSVNAMLANGEGLRRLKVNAAMCPDFAAGLEQQVYDKNGEPDKTQGKDHINDAGGYFIVYRFPVVRNGLQRARLGGH
jgi:phage terminase large subunit